MTNLLFMNVLATTTMLFVVTGLIVWMFFYAARLASNTSYVWATIIFLLVISVCGLMAIEELDELEDTFGLTTAWLHSLFFSAVAAGLIAGSMGNVAPIVGFISGMAIFSVIHLWLVPHASPWLGVSLVLSCCITGIIVGLFQKKESSDATDIHLR
jgi:membrane-associated HD superfamily phosphohydrolase